MHRRQFLGCGVSVLAATVFDRLYAAEYSTRAADLVAQSNVIDMLGLLTLDWPLLDRWQSAPGSFSEADFRKLQNSGIDVFHPAVAFEDARAYAITKAWFEKWNRFIDQHPAWFLRTSINAPISRAESGGENRHHPRDAVMPTICASWGDLDAFYKMEPSALRR